VKRRGKKESAKKDTPSVPRPTTTNQELKGKKYDGSVKNISREDKTELVCIASVQKPNDKGKKGRERKEKKKKKRKRRKKKKERKEEKKKKERAKITLEEGKKR